MEASRVLYDLRLEEYNWPNEDEEEKLEEKGARTNVNSCITAVIKAEASKEMVDDEGLGLVKVFSRRERGVEYDEDSSSTKSYEFPAKNLKKQRLC